MSIVKELGAGNYADDIEERLKEINRRDAACRGVGATFGKDIDGIEESKNLIKCRKQVKRKEDKQECFLYAVGHRGQNPQSLVPRVCFLGAFCDREAASRWVTQREEIYKDFANVFVQDTLIGEMVCETVEHQLDKEYKTTAIEKHFSEWRKELREKEAAFKKDYAERHGRALKEAAKKPGEEGTTTENTNNETQHRESKKQKNREANRQRAINSANSKNEKPPTDPDTILEETLKWKKAPPPLPDSARLPGQKFALMSFLPAKEPWFRFYSAWENKEDALEERKRIGAYVHNHNIDVVQMYDQWGRLDRQPDREEFTDGVDYRFSELDNIMKAPEREAERIAQARALMEAQEQELPEIEIDDDTPSVFESLDQAIANAKIPQVTLEGFTEKDPEKYWEEMRQKHYQEQLEKLQKLSEK